MGELRSLEDHLQICDYTKLPCPNQCKTVTILIFRKDLLKHLNDECPRRQHTCPHCKLTGEYSKITGSHRTVCPQMKIECLNQPCKALFLRKDKEKHLAICPYMKVVCKYKEFGCVKTPFRRDLAAHERNDQVHLRVFITTVVEMKRQFKEQYTVLKQENVTLHKQIQTITTSSVEMEKQFKDQCTTITTSSVEMEKQFKDQCTTITTSSVEMEKQFKEQFTELKEENASLHKQIQAMTITSSPNHLARSTECITFKIPNFAEKKKKDIEHFSAPFYTYPQGHKMVINVDTNGYGRYKGTHISVWAYLMKGEYDDTLDFPFIGTIKFELLNQLEDKHHHKDSNTFDGTEDGSKRVTDRARSCEAIGVTAFIPHSELGYNAAKNCQYLKDDFLVFRIYAEVSSYKPWLRCTS